MARNEEKANSMLYRFRKAMQSETEGWTNPNPNEPLLPTTCHSVQAALHTRKELYRDISRKIGRINDTELDDATIRSLNDDINRQLKKANEWDECLKRLGYTERDKTIKWGGEGTLFEARNVHGYIYFGRAKTLPGVQELLSPIKTDYANIPPKFIEMQKNADEEYFGITTSPEEEMANIQEEKKAELGLFALNATQLDWATGLPVHLPPFTEDLEAEIMNVPTQKQVEEYLIDQRRSELLLKYATDNE